MVFRIRKGLNIPIAGQPEQHIEPAAAVRSVALIGEDYLYFKRLPQVLVQPGQRVKLGEPLIRGKHQSNIVAVSPGSGTVTRIQRGNKRSLHSIVIALDNIDDGADEETFNRYSSQQVNLLNGEQVRDNLLASGLWLSFRTRPYSTTPAPDSEPFAIYVTAIDTNPLAPDPAVVIKPNRDDFVRGLMLISKLTHGAVYVCKAQGQDLDIPAGAPVKEVEFYGPHPAGLPGTHIHCLTPVYEHRTVWHIHYQDVIAIGQLFATGRLIPDRVVSLAGPGVVRPRLIRTRLGACMTDLVQQELLATPMRIISGPVLSGRHVAGERCFLGRYHYQIVALPEGGQRDLLGWIRPGLTKYSAINTFASALMRNRSRFEFNSLLQGNRRAMLPLGIYEKVMPLDILVTQLLRALLVGDIDVAKDLGCLELDEEDLALCSFVCPSKHEFGAVLRDNLDRMLKEGA